MSKIDKCTDFFAYVDNFAKYKHVESVRLYGEHNAVPPKVSITIPTYRRPELLKEAVESAVNQDGYDEYKGKSRSFYCFSQQEYCKKDGNY